MFTRNRSIALIVFTVVALMGIGWVVQSDRVQAVGGATYDLRLLGQVVNQIRARYVDELDEQKAIDAAIRGMLDTLDPYTEFLEKKQNDEMKMMQIQGKYGGLGIQIKKQDNVLVVVALFDDTPAYNAGLQTGDRIVRIDGRSTADINVTQAADLLRGEPGTSVAISIQRDEKEKEIDYALTRAIITIPVIPYAGVTHDDIGYIKLNQFTEDTGVEMEKALRKLQDQKVSGLILDLRGNPGGLMEQAVAVAGNFLEPGKLIVYTKGRQGSQEKSYHASSAYVVKDIPLAVLVDEYSASASEIVAGAIQDWDRGIVVGNTTFGKALVQQIFPMTDGTAIKITTARYYTPSGRLIQKMPREKNTPQDETAEMEKPAETPATEPVDQHKTRGGRLVYGGGGITPDFKASLPEIPTLLGALSEQSLFIKFAKPYTSSHPDIRPQTFEVTDAMIEEFHRFTQEKGFSYDTEAEQILKQLEEMVRKKTAEPEILKTIDTLRGQLIAQHQQDFESSRDLIKVRLGIEIGSKLWGSAGRYSYAVRHDPQIQTAVDILHDQKKYQTQLSARAEAPAEQRPH